ncbi:SWIB/MDM2 domain protein [Aspergillus glaucus CBS 516.65]|uniref:Uncharacterized protein n=1 Tax=Aspergillus glaucus CBS 516.65 TaxID=1160497 RepID=A0A1L9VSA7_ASPGL|nr:hypothetical protein ASPGLDRAFT_44673 [Aspergillus glaucus CBS 516.65]OJJ86808.1 hypothetical protein ASPGLDRAFT_44673 [Aspergillus glaucus CBS 516.65]
MSLPPETREQYIQVIDSILAQSDLNTISEKRIRRGLQDAVGHDLTPQKAAIKQLIMERFDIFADQDGINASGDGDKSAESTTNGHDNSGGSATPAEPSPSTLSASPQKRAAESEEPADSLDDASPPAKKQKPDHDIDADALFAAKLQAEENLRARPTRGASTRRAAPVKKKTKPKPKTKTSKKVKVEDDSDVGSGSESGKKEVKRSGGFHAPMALSPALSSLLNEEILSRPQTVKKMWEHIHKHELQDPSDRRHILCDDGMRAVFKQDRIHMFAMTKILNQNLYSPDD